MSTDSSPHVPAESPGTAGPSVDEGQASAPAWTSASKVSFNSPAADLNQLRNEAKRVAESAPAQPVHRAVLDRARRLAASLEHDLGLPESADGLCYADLAVLLAQSR
ncbi:MAG TPA: hypothetical protein PKE32_00235 [Miltoncostaeaceae bacterium]|nr:hypothetical protein [Miltoncostaeaceae bacterium]